MRCEIFYMVKSDEAQGWSLDWKLGVKYYKRVREANLTKITCKITIICYVIC